MLSAISRLRMHHAAAAPPPSRRLRVPTPPLTYAQTAKPASWLRAGEGLLNYALRLRGFRHVWVDTHGTTLHGMRAAGRGNLPPLVLIPGLGATVSDYMRLLWRLTPHFREVIVIELPGHGRSGMPQPVGAQAFFGAMAHAVQNLTPGPVMVLGHSLGGLTAMRINALLPGKFARLALVAPAGAPFTAAQREHYLDLFSLHHPRDVRILAAITWPAHRLRNRFLEAALPGRLLPAPIQALIRSDIFDAVPQKELKLLPDSTFLIWGQEEALLPWEHFHYFAQTLPPTRRILCAPATGHSSVATGGNGLLRPILRFMGTGA